MGKESLLLNHSHFISLSLHLLDKIFEYFTFTLFNTLLYLDLVPLIDIDTSTLLG